MISHRNYYAMVAVVDELPSFTGPEDTMLLYLPLAHNFGRLMHLSGAYVGYAIAFLPDPLQAAAALPQVRPTVFPSVPRVYEKVHTGGRREVRRGDRASSASWSTGRSASAASVSALRRAGKPVPAGLAAQHRLADRLVYSKVQGRGSAAGCGSAISGGAPLSPEIAEFFHAIDILLIEGYGLTECTTAASTNTHEALPLRHRRPAAARTRGEAGGGRRAADPQRDGLPGLLQGPRGDREVLDADGWLRTGDIAEIDEDGFITITDRKKDIIVTAGGKNVAPQNLENDLKTSKFDLAGDGRRRPAAVRRRADHARPRRAAEVGGGARSRRRAWRSSPGRAGARARPGDRRRGQRRPLALRADQALRDPAARLHDGATARSRRR